MMIPYALLSTPLIMMRMDEDEGEDEDEDEDDNRGYARIHAKRER